RLRRRRPRHVEPAPTAGGLRQRRRASPQSRRLPEAGRHGEPDAVFAINRRRAVPAWQPAREIELLSIGHYRVMKWATLAAIALLGTACGPRSRVDTPPAGVPQLQLAGQATRPNIIFILADDLGYGDLGSFWQDKGSHAAKKFDTPNLDRLAAEGVKLTHHYIGAPVCAPSRASLLTGRHQGHA